MNIRLPSASIPQLFEEQVLRSSDNIAVTFEAEQLTYSELNQKANQLAHYLQDLGIQPQTRIGICVERSLNMLIGLLGILKAGCAYVPVDPSHPIERTNLILEDASISLLLTTQQLVETLHATSLLQHQTQVICLDADAGNIAQYSEENLGVAIASDEIAYLIYTSGSTGTPKGVQIAHHSVINFLDSMSHRPGLTKQDVLLAVTTITFDISVLELFLPLSVGASVVIASGEMAGDGTQISRALEQHNITVMQATPATWQLLLQSGCQGNPALKILCGGEALSRKLANQLLQKCHVLWNLYGPTETTIWSTCHQVSTAEDSVSIGRPIANTQVYVLDEQLNPVAKGEAGELYIGGAGLAVGYLNRPTLNAERFITNPFDPDSQTRLYKTGDLVKFRADGNLDYLGRIDHQVKIRGFRIELGEIEALLNQLNTIQDTVVVAREDRPGDKRLVAYLIPSSQKSHAPTPTELRNWLTERLPDYMIPAYFMFLEAFPLNSNGKVDRKALPAPDASQLPLKADWVAPQTAIEKTLAQIWSDVLGLEKVGIEDCWLDLGGNSLLATQILSQIRTVYGIDLSLRCLFEAPTIATLAQQIDTQLANGQFSNIPAIQPLPQRHNLPLSYAQARLWFLAQLEPDQTSYNVPAAVRLTGALNLQRLSASLNQIIQRHEVLRTTFTTVDGQPQQVIQSVTGLNISLISLEILPPAERGSKAQQILLQQTQQPFNLSKDALFRVTVLQLNPQESILLLVLHHILCDEWSMKLLFEELSLLYNPANSSTTLPQLSVQYGDFAVWQHQWLQGEVLEKQLNYWRQQMADLPQLQLPTDYPRPTHPTDKGARQSLTLSPSLTTALGELSRQEGVTLFMTLLAGLQVLLYRYTSQEDLAVATPVANRHHRDVEPLMGFFVNLIMLRTDLSGAPSFRELLQRVRQVAIEAYQHQDLPFEKLVDELNPQRSLSSQPLFNVMFVLQNRHFSQYLQLDGLQQQFIEIDNGTAKCDLVLQLTETPQGLTGYFEYCTDLFKAETIRAMVGHFQTLLSALVADANQPITKLPILTTAKTHQRLVSYHQTQTDYPQQQCIHQRFEAQVQQQPEAVAVVFGDEQLTYDQLNRRANQLAHYLQDLGIQPKTRIGICVERSLEMLIGLLGILKAGCAYVPLDPTHPIDRTRLILEDASISFLLTQKHLVETLRATSLLQHQTQLICLDADAAHIAQYSEENLLTANTANDIAYLIYTSGSTGKPKGVQMAHRGVTNILKAFTNTLGVSQTDRIVTIASICFDMSVGDMFLSLMVGACVVIASSEVITDVVQLGKLLDTSGATMMQATPATWQMLRRSGWKGNRHLNVWSGGEALPRTLADWLLERSASVWNIYGPTETTIWTTMTQVEPGTESIHIGKPILNAEVYVLDEQLNPVANGVAGELYIGGVGLAVGYLNRPTLNAERFIANPFDLSGQTRLYKTGDLVKLRGDGNLDYVGRSDHQVKIRGFRIELGEIEAVLCQFETVQDTVVVAREDRPGDKRLVAYMISAPSEQPQHDPTSNELRDWLRKQLPDYMIPAYFVFLDAFPLNSNGKVDRKALPAPDHSRSDLEEKFVAPQTVLKQQMATIWSEVLEIHPLGINDNFFDLGGNSLLAARTIAKMQETLNQEIPVRHLFERPTIDQLAQKLDYLQTVETESTTVNLKADVVLPAEIRPQGIANLVKISQPKHIFLTGTTGFLGGFLLDELLHKTSATLHCFVRAADAQQGMKKIQKNLEKYLLWNPEFRHRIIPIAGDLEKPLLGLTAAQFDQLAAQIDVIYHSGAQVNFIKPYSAVKTANVIGTQEILKLAVQTQVKPVHYISTAGVFGPVGHFEDCPVLLEDQDLNHYEKYVALDLGYSQSKWVAEQMVKVAQSRGLPVTIMRPGFTLGHPQTGVTNTKDFWSRLMIGCLQMGYFPNLVDQREEFIPVNYVSQAIVHLSMQSNSIGQVFHLTPPQHSLTTVELFELIQSLGYPLQPLPYPQWIKVLLQYTKQSPNHALVPLLPMLSEKVYDGLTIMEIYQNNPEYDCKNTLTGLQGSSIHCPEIDCSMMEIYLSYFMKIGFIEPLIPNKIG
ncbi:MAG: amino acid adenylation domain-containing protein [Microcoleaceae cyanobacterium]